jgi:hypothetical protein
LKINQSRQRNSKKEQSNLDGIESNSHEVGVTSVDDLLIFYWRTHNRDVTKNRQSAKRVFRATCAHVDLPYRTEAYRNTNNIELYMEWNSSKYYKYSWRCLCVNKHIPFKCGHRVINRKHTSRLLGTLIAYKLLH